MVLRESLEKFQNKSSWTPISTHQALNVFKMAFKHDLLYCKIKRPRKYNLTKGELSGLTNLRQNPDITIKKADKGSAAGVMNTSDYHRKGYKYKMTNFTLKYPRPNP